MTSVLPNHRTSKLFSAPLVVIVGAAIPFEFFVFFNIWFKKVSSNKKYAKRWVFLSNAKTFIKQSMLENDVTFRNTLFLICSLVRFCFCAVTSTVVLMSLFYTPNTFALTHPHCFSIFLLADFTRLHEPSTFTTCKNFHIHTQTHIVQSVLHFKWSFAGGIFGRVWYSLFLREKKRTSSVCLSVCCRPFWLLLSLSFVLAPIPFE